MAILEEVHIIEKNWEVLAGKYNESGAAFTDRIVRKIEEVESLRDGLFNAQSVREAVKGTQINQFLLVFTVVTIAYLPPTFVATFYGMHLFDDEEVKPSTKTQFWTVLAAVSGATYLVAIVLLTSVQQFKTLLTLPDAVKPWFPRVPDSKYEPQEKRNQHEGPSGADKLSKYIRLWWASMRSEGQGPGTGDA
ncbi:hypothetical protein QBC44DRAFT_49622 [Cladorrhinum sp. PSN332]|nr:hypothetical protein QBC44DRAFT_49622 [Cladorrhinum sp. PSN332]